MVRDATKDSQRRDPADDIPWRNDVWSMSVPVATTARSGAAEGEYEDVPPRPSAKRSSSKRSGFLAFCIAISVLMAVAAVIISIVAFTKSPHGSSVETSHIDDDDSSDSTGSVSDTVSDFYGGGGEGDESLSTVSEASVSVASISEASVSSVSSASKSMNNPTPPPTPPPTQPPTNSASTGRVAAAARPVATDAGEADVIVFFLCTIRPPGSNVCLSVFSYENGGSSQIVVPAGTSANTVSTAVGGDAGQPETFLPGLHFGAASFMWDCSSVAETTWTLETGSAGGGVSTATALADAKACPASVNW